MGAVPLADHRGAAEGCSSPQVVGEQLCCPVACPQDLPKFLWWCHRPAPPSLPVPHQLSLRHRAHDAPVHGDLLGLLSSHDDPAYCDREGASPERGGVDGGDL